ncbi:MAG: hypothetical protein B7Z60_06990 [Ferrovum sp. 37-45-19]|jgi:sterol desaturase/sphingolipid hydroxylase (fatty acid hydroxylase superfamily)|uniref:sterol desaturase family protein n=1 Tax=Ferrovum sp. JA12 TaxID=1356299 RepID=UPI000702B12B|nr:sterol desaturase family protein [Ferrovum sp. JA12]OYV78754.1 MAG: hypothetical protein B7Z65_08855 [Ferrovum sp. 21-44-67]OYV93941.1 MAG: hypothetical protein B7Z60_06990 [Ferrovum sp. 37-45-19]OZB31991.1 MAG: hypothetical protein B7X47_07670 [Ferrovum sp. 34-44-207]HQT81999.1 sterol desaturase family protein [Ferrovaceae bacterium]KRH78982.1 fatty acid hydroxylase superfamily protein [Ferrovum sp. JA12]
MRQILQFPFFIVILSVLPLIIVERLYPLHHYKLDVAWLFRLGVFSGLGIFLTLLIGNHVFIHHNLSLFHLLQITFLTQQPLFIQGAVGYFMITFVVYWWHRLRHHSDLLWKTFHQVHHSTYRIQSLTAVYAHPLDFMSTALIINTVSYLVLGLDTEAAVLTSIITSFFDFWEHTNIKTPKWLGYFLVRPEMHRIHHEQYKHNNNYSIPIWDILFGTYENSNRSVECGFDGEKERKVMRLITFHNVDQ